MKNTINATEQTFTELLANKRLTKENMHQAIETVAGIYMGFKSTAYSHETSRNWESITVYAHFHGGKTYCGIAQVQAGTTALEAISTALVKLNENIRLGFEANAQPAPLECLEVHTHGGEVITDAFLSETDHSDLRTPFVAA